jgi:hypothetical protein
MSSSQATDPIMDLSAAQRSASASVRSTTLNSPASRPTQDDSHHDETMPNPNVDRLRHELSAPTCLELSTRTCCSQDVVLFDSPQRIRKEQQPHNLFQTRIRRAILGGLAGGCITLCCLLLVHLVYPSALPRFSRVICPRGACHDWQFEVSIRGAPSPTGVDSYLDHFGGGAKHNHKHNSSSSKSAWTRRNLTQTHPRHHHHHQKQRKLASFHDPELVIAGKMTVEDGPCNIAQLDLKTSEWSLPERIQLSLYNSYSGGEVYSLLANHTYQIPFDEDGDSDDAKK